MTQGPVYQHSARITWDRDPNWNEICAWAVEHLGLPGDRYITDLDPEWMQFHFRDARDQLLFMTAWGSD